MLEVLEEVEVVEDEVDVVEVLEVELEVDEDVDVVEVDELVVLNVIAVSSDPRFAIVFKLFPQYATSYLRQSCILHKLLH